MELITGVNSNTTRYVTDDVNSCWERTIDVMISSRSLE